MQYIQEKFKYPYSLTFPTFINLEENHRYKQKYISPQKKKNTLVPVLFIVLKTLKWSK